MTPLGTAETIDHLTVRNFMGTVPLLGPGGLQKTLGTVGTSGISTISLTLTSNYLEYLAPASAGCGKLANC